MSPGLTQKDAAARLGVSPTTLRRLSQAGTVPRDESGRYPWPAVREAFERRDQPGTESLTQREAARRLGVTTKWLRDLTRRGEVPRNEDKTYPWPEIAEAYEAFKRAATEGKSGPADFRTEQARLARAKAEAQEMDNAERRREIVAMEDVDRMVRESLEKADVIAQSLPTRYAARLAREAGLSLAKARKILGELSESIRDELRDAPT